MYFMLNSYSPEMEHFTFKHSTQRVLDGSGWTSGKPNLSRDTDYGYLHDNQNCPPKQPKPPVFPFLTCDKGCAATSDGNDPRRRIPKTGRCKLPVAGQTNPRNRTAVVDARIWELRSPTRYMLRPLCQLKC
jgi:hypothetical protein